MWEWVHPTLHFVALGLLLAVNAAGVVLVVLQMPGTWLMVAATAVVSWWTWDSGGPTIGVWTVLVMLGLALFGEAVETFSGAAAAHRAGGSKRGIVIATIAAVAGAIVGSMAWPLVGTILGACVGAALGAMLGDRWAGRSWREATDAARGAALGRFWGTLGKIVVAAVMWIVAAVAVFWP